MKLLVMLLGVVATASMATAAGASASTLTSPAGTAWTGTVKADNELGYVKLHTQFASHTCESSRIEWSVSSHGAAATAKGALTQLSFGQCGAAKVTVIKLGTLEIHKGNGIPPTQWDWMTWNGSPEITVSSGGVHCVYSLELTGPIYFGALTNSQDTQATATIHLLTERIPAKSFLCGSYIELTGAFPVSTPDYLDLD